MAYTLSETIQRCAEALKEECLVRSVGLRVPRAPAGSVTVAQPALEPEGELGGVPIRALSQALYRRDNPSLLSVTEGWQDSLGAYISERSSSRSLQRIARQVFPSVPFTIVKEHDERSLLIQYLIASSWYYGRLSIAPRTVILMLDEGRMSVEKSSIEWLHGRRRLPTPMTFSALSCMHMQLGARKALSSRCGSLYRHLLHALPHRANEMSNLFGAAAYLGSEHQATLVDTFDVDWAGAQERPDLVLWDQALRLVDHAVRNPYAQIRSLLVPAVISRADFSDLFGNGKGKQGAPTFTNAARQELRKAVITGQNVYAAKVVDAPEPEESVPEDAQAILDLQRMLGGSA